MDFCITQTLFSVKLNMLMMMVMCMVAMCMVLVFKNIRGTFRHLN